MVLMGIRIIIHVIHVIQAQIIELRVELIVLEAFAQQVENFVALIFLQCYKS